MTATDHSATRLKRESVADASVHPAPGSARGVPSRTATRQANPPIQVATAVRWVASTATDNGASGAWDAWPWAATAPVAPRRPQRRTPRRTSASPTRRRGAHGVAVGDKRPAPRNHDLTRIARGRARRAGIDPDPVTVHDGPSRR